MTRRPLLLGALIVGILVGGVVAAVLQDDDGGDHPSAWDERVVDLAEFVEDERNLSFDHPVHVDFLTDDEFTEFVTTDRADLTEEDEEEIEHTAAILRALGLLAADIDVLDAVNRLGEVNVLAFYDPRTDRVRVKGTELTPHVRLTLVHELTHALQDQHFDIGRLRDIEEETESSTYRGIIEGDAGRIEDAYLETLEQGERDAIDEQRQKDFEEVEAADLPPVLEAIVGAPYALGEPLVAAVLEADGRAGLNDALREPPTTDEPLLDPIGFLEGEHEEQVEVDAPRLGDGEEEVDRGFFGPVGWYVMLAQRMQPRTALQAADGWGGDAYVAFERDGTVCVRIAYRGDTDAEADELHEALEAWVDEMPRDAARVEREGDDGLVLESCDPGDDASVPDDVSAEDLMVLPAARSTLGAALLGQGASAEQARCFATEAVAILDEEQLQADELDPATMRALQDIGARCR